MVSKKAGAAGLGLRFALTLTVALAMPTAHALDAAAARKLAAANACMGCHALDRKVVGPSFRQVAEKYRGDPGALAKLMKKVQQGGSGVWGQLPMPSHPRLSDADAKTLVEWVLAGAPAE
jgi:cytochrome c